MIKKVSVIQSQLRGQQETIFGRTEIDSYVFYLARQPRGSRKHVWDCTLCKTQGVEYSSLVAHYSLLRRTWGLPSWSVDRCKHSIHLQTHGLWRETESHCCALGTLWLPTSHRSGNHCFRLEGKNCWDFSVRKLFQARIKRSSRSQRGDDAISVTSVEIQV